MTKKKIYVLDTSVCLTNFKSLFSYGTSDIVLPLKVLEELDKHKPRQDGVGQNARSFIKALDELREVGSLKDGVKIEKNKGKVSVAAFDSNTNFPTDLDMSVPDHVILATAYGVSLKNPKAEVIVVSRDINMRVICDSIGLKSETYDATQVINDSSELYSGCDERIVPRDVIEDIYSGEEVVLDESLTDGLFPNQFLTLVSDENLNSTVLVRFLEPGRPVRKVDSYKGKSRVFGLDARNREQSFAMDLLMDPSVPIVTLVGKAGSGKTVSAIAAGLEQLLQKTTYTRMIVSRPVQPMGKDIGFLPGPQPLDAKIAVPTGWTTMGQLKVGDSVISRNGQPTKVLEIFPKGEKEIYRVTTTDGTSTECCADHLWFTETFENKKRKKNGSVKSTKQMMESLYANKASLSSKRRHLNVPNHYLPRNEAVQYKKQELPITPYVMGCLLGDGSIVGEVMLTNTDQELLTRVNSELNTCGYKLNRSGESIVYRIQPVIPFRANKQWRPVNITNFVTSESSVFKTLDSAADYYEINKNTLKSRCEKGITVNNDIFSFGEKPQRWSNQIKQHIEDLGLTGKYSNTKFIPECYKYSSIEDRLDLLRGLMDCDGSIKRSGEASYTTTSETLANDVIELVRSLGGRATRRMRDRTKNDHKASINGRLINTNHVSYEFTVSLPEKYNPFYISRKAVRHKCSSMHYVGISSIELIGKKEAQCILIEDEEHLYLTDDFIVTHNTIQDKMLPWLAPIQDNLQFLLGNDKATLEGYIDSGKIEIEALTYIRGRSIAKAFMIIDEAQNLSAHELKTIVTRVGEGTKIVLTGDIEQIDNVYVNDTSNGLAYAVEKFKVTPLAGHISLLHGERSAVATMAAKLL